MPEQNRWDFNVRCLSPPSFLYSGTGQRLLPTPVTGISVRLT